MIFAPHLPRLCKTDGKPVLQLRTKSSEKSRQVRPLFLAQGLKMILESLCRPQVLHLQLCLVPAYFSLVREVEVKLYLSLQLLGKMKKPKSLMILIFLKPHLSLSKSKTPIPKMSITIYRMPHTFPFFPLFHLLKSQLFNPKTLILHLRILHIPLTVQNQTAPLHPCLIYTHQIRRRRRLDLNLWISIVTLHTLRIQCSLETP